MLLIRQNPNETRNIENNYLIRLFCKQHYLDPKDKLAAYVKQYGLKSNEFTVLKHGEIVEF